MPSQTGGGHTGHLSGGAPRCAAVHQNVLDVAIEVEKSFMFFIVNRRESFSALDLLLYLRARAGLDKRRRQVAEAPAGLLGWLSTINGGWWGRW